MLVQRTPPPPRRGAVTVEFALMAPVFLVLVLGVTETARMFDLQNQLQVAAREGARMAAMDRAGLVGEGQSTNAKVIQDVKNFLEASGIDPDQVNVQIVSHDDPSAAFNLDDPANSLKYFQLKISVPFHASSTVVPDAVNFKLESKIVFRNAKAQVAN
jgi:Flp pilus assembly protein TadG